MNARQTKKRLKMRIERLESDNDLMRKIIDNSPRMAELYNLYNRPCNVIESTMRLQEYKFERVIPHYMADIEDYAEHVRHALARDIAEVIVKDIHYESVEKCGERAIEASIYIGRK